MLLTCFVLLCLRARTGRVNITVSAVDKVGALAEAVLELIAVPVVVPGEGGSCQIADKYPSFILR